MNPHESVSLELFIRNLGLYKQFCFISHFKLLSKDIKKYLQCNFHGNFFGKINKDENFVRKPINDIKMKNSIHHILLK